MGIIEVLFSILGVLSFALAIESFGRRRKLRRKRRELLESAKTCPMCGVDVQPNAHECRSCGEDLSFLVVHTYKRRPIPAREQIQMSLQTMRYSMLGGPPPSWMSPTGAQGFRRVGLLSWAMLLLLIGAGLKEILQTLF